MDKGIVQGGELHEFGKVYGTPGHQEVYLPMDTGQLLCVTDELWNIYSNQLAQAELRPGRSYGMQQGVFYDRERAIFSAIRVDSLEFDRAKNDPDTMTRTIATSTSTETYTQIKFRWKRKTGTSGNFDCKMEVPDLIEVNRLNLRLQIRDGYAHLMFPDEVPSPLPDPLIEAKVAVLEAQGQPIKPEFYLYRGYTDAEILAAAFGGGFAVMAGVGDQPAQVFEIGGTAFSRYFNCDALTAVPRDYKETLEEAKRILRKKLQEENFLALPGRMRERDEVLARRKLGL